MGTVDKGIADKIKAGDGYYADDPRVWRIIKYTNMAGTDAYGLEYERDIGKYSASPYVRNPTVYFEITGRRTDGK